MFIRAAQPMIFEAKLQSMVGFEGDIACPTELSILAGMCWYSFRS